VNTILHVYRKEVRDMFRDKRVRYSAFVGPIFTIVLMIGLLGFIANTVGKKEGQKIHLVKTTHPAADILRKAKFDVVDVASKEEGEKLVREGKAHVVLLFGPKSKEGQTEIQAFYDPKEQTAQIGLSVVQKVYEEVNRQVLKGLFAAKGLPQGSDQAFKIVERTVQVGAKEGAGEFLLGFLPYLTIIWAFYGGMGIASDLVAGEKEKNTLETLLISPAVRTQIVMGKFLALSTVCLMSSLSCILGLKLVSVLKLPGTDVMFKGGFGVTPAAFAMILAILVPLVAFFASLLIAISSFARNPREAQTYLGQFSLVVMLPAVFSQFIGLTDAGHSMWINFVPVLNAANGIRSALLGKAEFTGIAITVGTSLVIALAAIRLTIHMFNREEVLVRV
jgi:sodium transport system permease protein